MKPGERRLLELTGVRNLNARDFPQPKGRGPNGRRLCRWCHAEVAPRRHTFCSDECVREFNLMVDGRMRRQYVYDRDGWVCRSCRGPLVPWSSIAWWARTFTHSLIGSDEPVRAMIAELEWPFNNAPYEVDHILPLVEGGSNHPSNLRLLCIPCHRGETAALAARRAKSNQGAKHELSNRNQPTT